MFGVEATRLTGAKSPTAVEGEILEQADVDRVRRDVPHEHGIAVGGGARGQLGADVSARSAAVLHHHALPSVSPSFCATMRPTMSVPPPGG